jgi:hypothetical protein
MNKKIIILAFLFNATLASGQVEKLLVPSDLKQQTIVTEPLTLRKGFFRPGLAMSYGFLDKYFTKDGKKEYFPQSSYGTDYSFLFMFDYGLTDRLQLEAQTEYHSSVQVSDSKLIWPELDTNALHKFRNSGKGIGDSYLGVKYQLVKETENKPSLSGEVYLTIPTGRKNPSNIKSATKYDLPTGYGCFDLELTLRTKYIRYPYSVTGYADYSYSFPGSKIINATDKTETSFKYGNRFEIGAGFDFQMNDWIALSNDLIYTQISEGEFKFTTPQKIDPTSVFSYEIRLVFQVKRFRIGEGVRVPLKGKNTGADPGYVLLFQYVF